MHILEQPQPCAICGRTTPRSYGANGTPICVICKSASLQHRAALIGGRTWGARWEIVMRAINSMAVRGGIKLARIERGR